MKCYNSLNLVDTVKDKRVEQTDDHIWLRSQFVYGAHLENDVMVDSFTSRDEESNDRQALFPRLSLQSEIQRLDKKAFGLVVLPIYGKLKYTFELTQNILVIVICDMFLFVLSTKLAEQTLMLPIYFWNIQYLKFSNTIDYMPFIGKL